MVITVGRYGGTLEYEFGFENVNDMRRPIVEGWDLILVGKVGSFNEQRMKDNYGNADDDGGGAAAAAMMIILPPPRMAMIAMTMTMTMTKMAFEFS